MGIFSRRKRRHRSDAQRRRDNDDVTSFTAMPPHMYGGGIGVDDDRHRPDDEMFVDRHGRVEDGSGVDVRHHGHTSHDSGHSHSSDSGNSHSSSDSGSSGGGSDGGGGGGGGD